MANAPADRTDALATSSGQRRMWLLDRLETGRTVYNVVLPIRLSGQLDEQALAASLTDVVARHEVLRTTYRAESGEPLQVVGPPLPVALPLTDLSGLSRADRASAVKQAYAEEENEPLDLAEGPILRARLLQLATDEHVLLICVHHIAMDAASRTILLREVAAGYSARRNGTAAALSALIEQYADYAVRQAADLSGPQREGHLGYWRERLDGLPVLDLPTDRTAPEVPSGNGGFVRQQIPEVMLAGLRSLAEAEGASLTSVLLAGVQAVLSRYTGQDDFAVGATTDGRDRPELAPLIGYFANTVVLRSDLDGAPGFRELVRRADRTLREATEHSWIPFDTLVQELAPERTAGGRSPFFRVYAGVYDSTDEVLHFDGLDAQAMASDFSTARFDLGLVLDIGPDGATLDCSLDLDLFDEATAQRMLGHLYTLLASGVAEPDRPVTDLRLLTEPEFHDILVTWNDTETPFRADARLHQLFEERAAAHGDLVAVACGPVELTYAELDQRANQLAHRLRRLGVGRDVVVAVYLPRSVRQAVAALGILKAGGAFLPMDPDYPAERVAVMLDNAKAWGILTAGEMADRLDAGVNTLLLDSPDLEAELSGEPVEAPQVTVSAEDLAFVMYTSGSTGVPKGIALQHRGAVNNYTDFNRRFGVGPGDSVLGVSSPSFDMSIYDMMGTFAAGAKLVLPEPEAVKEPARWVELLRRHRVTIWHSAPALLELVVERLAAEGGSLPDLRLALLSGDWIAVDLPARLSRVATVEFIALGGATEASMDSVIYPVSTVDPAWTSIPYGRPMANQRTYVLDRNGQPQPIGIPGELYLGGVGLARGYLNRPELTAERFVLHTFPDGRTERLYRTGDLARYRPDGALELLGRIDFQVKVHGLRIELNEIEAALRRNPAVAEAVVVAQGQRGNHSLAGFVTTSAATSPEARDVLVRQLREELLTVLPSYMVPAVLVTLDALPTTPNGKVDRQALAKWETSGDRAGQAPRDPLEARIAGIWRQIIGIDRIGIDDDFFRIGGDSFMAVRAMMALDSEMAVIELFKNPTVRALAARLRMSDTGERFLLHQLTPAGRDAAVTMVCLPYGGGNAIAYQPLAEALPDGMALWALSQPGYDSYGSRQDFRPFDDIVAAVATEVAERVTGPVVVYGHCAGTAMAAALAPALEARGVDLRGVYLAASLPERDPVAALATERATDNTAWADYLRSLGGLNGALDWATIDHIMVAGRHDHFGAMEFHRRSQDTPPVPIKAPLRCVFGDADPATAGWQERHGDWGRFGRIDGVDIIADGGHYFVRDHAAELAKLVAARYLDAVAGVPGAA